MGVQDQPWRSGPPMSSRKGDAENGGDEVAAGVDMDQIDALGRDQIGEASRRT